MSNAKTSDLSGQLPKLVANAFDFLNRALNDFPKNPKYAVIHFYAAIELLLKARLFKEHWSLVVSKPESSDRNRFLAGDFQSVTLAEAAKRLEAVAGDPLTSAELAAFRALAAHRNRMVHFFHPSEGTAVQAEAEVIAAEQCNAWYHLHRLLTSRWKDAFADFQDQIADMGKRMHQHNEFLSAKFEIIKPVLLKAAKVGHSVDECYACKFAAQIVDDEAGPVEWSTCKVCKASQGSVTFDCLKCEHSIRSIQEGFGKCPKCKTEYEPRHVMKALDDVIVPPDDDMDIPSEIHCGECLYPSGTVGEIEGRLICVGCFAEHNDDDIGACGWCNEGWAGYDLSESEWKGCEFCEGRAASIRDD